mmetsp:Transcript_19354/g.37388  ORF Transcript_19354/g.37388 Transcript_19354/m.37388 type:complete len:90 (+) Transcript_19354:45-314(+)
MNEQMHNACSSSMGRAHRLEGSSFSLFDSCCMAWRSAEPVACIAHVSAHIIVRRYDGSDDVHSGSVEGELIEIKYSERKVRFNLSRLWQ